MENFVFILKTILAIYGVISMIFAVVGIVFALKQRKTLDYSPVEWFSFIIGIILLSVIWIISITAISADSPKRKEDMAEREARKKAKEEQDEK